MVVQLLDTHQEILKRHSHKYNELFSINNRLLTKYSSFNAKTFEVTSDFTTQEGNYLDEMEEEYSLDDSSINSGGNSQAGQQSEVEVAEAVRKTLLEALGDRGDDDSTSAKSGASRRTTFFHQQETAIFAQ